MEPEAFDMTLELLRSSLRAVPLASPVEVLWELMADIALRMAEAYRKGVREQGVNPTLVTLKEVDSLNNPRIISKRKRREIIHDVETAKFLTNLAMLSTWMRRNPRNPLSIAESEIGISLQRRKPQTSKQAQHLARKNESGYFRRRYLKRKSTD